MDGGRDGRSEQARRKSELNRELQKTVGIQEIGTGADSQEKRKNRLRFHQKHWVYAIFGLFPNSGHPSDPRPRFLRFIGVRRMK